MRAHLRSVAPALAVLLLPVPVPGAVPSSPAPPPRAEITLFAPASGVVAPGGRAASALRFHNADGEPRRFWVGCSVRDPRGEWHDVPARALEVGGGTESGRVGLSWRVPADAVPGAYRVVMAVWDAPPESGRAARLASAERDAAFVVSASEAAPSEARGWTAADHALGRGRFQPVNVARRGGVTLLRLPAGRHDGAEISSPARYRTGSFRVRMRTADAPGSISAFFLYEGEPGDANDEVDVEVVNDGSRRVLLSTWVDGRLTHGEERVLPFDPRAAFHEYRIDLLPSAVRFLVDGELLAAWTSGLPARPMRVMASAWWPRWLDAPAPRRTVHTAIEGLEARGR